MSSRVEAARAALRGVTDPEIPVVTIEELGILREVTDRGDELEVVITPTYSGCPAMGQIEDDVRQALAQHGLHARVTTRLAPAWTTDWITPEAREKLRDFGIAPPVSGASGAEAQTVRFMKARRDAAVPCPRCGSTNTTEISRFGSTACKSLHRCLDCLEPFDHFKPY